MNSYRNRCARRSWPVLIGLLGALGASALVSAERSIDPSYTFHAALAGAEADTIDLSGAPLRHDVHIFYEHTFGKFPAIDLDTGAMINGGLPHAVDYDAHIAACLRDIEEQIPDPEWDGYVVIDYESWTPWWNDTTRRYREATISDIERRLPDLNAAETENIAILLYEYYARQIFEGTIELGKSLRPNARWGYWSYPKSRHADLPEAQWLWDLTEVFYPSVYMRDYLVPDHVELQLGEAHYTSYIEDVLEGRVAFARQLAGERPVLAFAWPRYGRTNPNQWIRLRELAPQHLRFVVQSPYFWGADGLVLWDNINQPGVAAAFQDYFDETIAPEMQTMHEFVLERDLEDQQDRVREDINCDGVVDIVDLAILINRFGTDDPMADVNGDGIVDTADLSLVRNAMQG